MIYDVIKKVLTQELGLDEDQIRQEAYIEKDLELDSTETVAVALALKKKFGVEYLFPKEDVSIAEIVKFVESHIPEKI